METLMGCGRARAEQLTSRAHHILLPNVFTRTSTAKAEQSGILSFLAFGDGRAPESSCRSRRRRGTEKRSFLTSSSAIAFLCTPFTGGGCKRFGNTQEQASPICLLVQLQATALSGRVARTGNHHADGQEKRDYSTRQNVPCRDRNTKRAAVTKTEPTTTATTTYAHSRTRAKVLS